MLFSFPNVDEHPTQQAFSHVADAVSLVQVDLIRWELVAAVATGLRFWLHSNFLITNVLINVGAGTYIQGACWPPPVINM